MFYLFHYDVSWLVQKWHNSDIHTMSSSIYQTPWKLFYTKLHTPYIAKSEVVQIFLYMEQTPNEVPR